MYSGVANRGANAFYLFCCGVMWTSSNCWPDLSEAQRGLDVVLRDRVMLEGPGDYCGGGGSGEIHFI